MPEYLAPGVYVEETSFRAKSIEGVGTSTTAFVGPTRRGPLEGTPELVTSYADFERIYGGMGPVHGGVNYLAHGVRAFFNEGGARLYVARVYTPPAVGDGRARSAFVVGTEATPASGQARFVARFPGSAGNGLVRLRKVYQPATATTLARAPAGSFLRIGGTAPASPARVASTHGGPFALQDGDELIVQVGAGPAATVAFHGASAEATAQVALADPVDLSAVAKAADRTLTVTIDGQAQRIVVPAASHARDDLVALIDGKLRGGYAALKGNKLVIGTEREGAGAAVVVDKATSFGFSAQASGTTAAGADNNVADLRAVTVAELDALLTPHGVRATVNAEGKLELSTATTGEAARLWVLESSATAALGLPAQKITDPPAAGTSGPTLSWFTRSGQDWKDGGTTLDLAAPGALSAGADLVTLLVETVDGDGVRAAYEGLALGREHPRYLGTVLSENPSRRSDWLEQAFAFVAGQGVGARALHDGLFGAGGAGDTNELALAGGGDGLAPATGAYEDALEWLKPLEDISILAAPGHTAYEDWQGIQGALISHVSHPRAYQIAVLDTPSGQQVSGAREARSRIDSTYAALYFPWVTVPNPVFRPGREDIPRELDLPPSAFLAGIYARNDVRRGVHKAPANEVVLGALRFETDINFDEQGVLNPIGVNCLRFFPGRGYRVWGARTASSDPEWKYVNIRRYFNYLERSIDVGTQWAVFEPNGEALWANVRQTISSFLYNEWRNGALLGTDPKQAYFVRCDRSTMDQNDLDNGRLVCLIGVAVVKPAEFVIFRIGQKTADARE